MVSSAQCNATIPSRATIPKPPYCNPSAHAIPTTIQSARPRGSGTTAGSPPLDRLLHCSSLWSLPRQRGERKAEARRRAAPTRNMLHNHTRDADPCLLDWVCCRCLGVWLDRHRVRPDTAGSMGIALVKAGSTRTVAHPRHPLNSHKGCGPSARTRHRASSRLRE